MQGLIVKIFGGSGSRRSPERRARRANLQVRKRLGFEALEDRRLMSGFARSFDSHPASDIVVWRPSNGTWYISTSGTNFDYARHFSRQFGAAGDVPIQNSDFDGDGRADIAIWRPSNGTWYISPSSTGFDYARHFSRQFGAITDIPILGGRGSTDPQVTRQARVPAESGILLLDLPGFGQVRVSVSNPAATVVTTLMNTTSETIEVTRSTPSGVHQALLGPGQSQSVAFTIPDYSRNTFGQVWRVRRGSRVATIRIDTTVAPGLANLADFLATVEYSLARS